VKSIKEIINLSADYLKKGGVECARVDAEWLISYALDMKRMDLYLQFDKPLPEEELNKIRPLLSRRAKGEPVQYICGSTEFYGLPFEVGPGVLIPRPETELLVDHALKYIQEGDSVLDLCTGSGAIAISLAKNKNIIITATDICDEALQFARKNAALNEVAVEFLSGDLFSPLQGRQFNMICSNPPYVTNGEASTMGREVLDFEPHKALFAGDDGFDILNKIATEAKSYLSDGGRVICEIGSIQGDACRDLFISQAWNNVEILQDYSKRDRYVTAVN
jgi:release factor glutamine methyltransferase